MAPLTHPVVREVFVNDAIHIELMGDTVYTVNLIFVFISMCCHNAIWCFWFCIVHDFTTPLYSTAVFALHITVDVRKHIVFTVSNIVKTLVNAYSRCSLRPTLLQLGYVLGPGSLSLLVFVLCPHCSFTDTAAVWSITAETLHAKPKLLELAYPWRGFAGF